MDDLDFADVHGHCDSPNPPTDDDFHQPVNQGEREAFEAAELSTLVQVDTDIGTRSRSPSPPPPLPPLEEDAVSALPTEGEPIPAVAAAPARPRRKIGPRDFELLTVIGVGAFGKVLQVRNRLNGNIYAMKCISKKMLRRRNHVTYMQAERDIMTKVDHPFVVGLKCAFQTEQKLFLVMEFLPGGELFFHLSKGGLFLEDHARIYAAEMVLALEHLHVKGIIHRDLKPENLLLGADGHISLTDFGLAKELTVEEDEGLKTICGTNEYMAPEMILRKGYGKAVDWWSMGTLLYEMMTGHPPFRGRTLKELNRKILNDKVVLPTWLSPSAHQILRGFLERSVNKRLGAARATMFEVGGVAAVKAHPFFQTIDFVKLLKKEIPAPLRPQLDGPADTSNFHPDFVGLELPRSFSEDSVLSSHGGPESRANGEDCGGGVAAASGGGAGMAAAAALADGGGGGAQEGRQQRAPLSFPAPVGPRPHASDRSGGSEVFRGFSFVADAFLAGNEPSPVHSTDGSIELDNGFYYVPKIKNKLAAAAAAAAQKDTSGAAEGGAAGEEGGAALEKQRKPKGKRVRKKKGEGAGAQAAAAAAAETVTVVAPAEEETLAASGEEASCGSTSGLGAVPCPPAAEVDPPRTKLQAMLERQLSGESDVVTAQRGEPESVWHVQRSPQPALVPTPLPSLPSFSPPPAAAAAGPAPGSWAAIAAAKRA